MNNLPRQTLRRIVDKYGKEIGGDAKRCESLLNDLCGAYRREINVLVNAADERVPLDILNGAASMPLELLLSRLEKRLAEQTAMTAEAASWAVESWALALDAATVAEIEARAKKRVDASSPNSDWGTIQPKRSSETGAVPPQNRPNSSQTPKPPAAIPPPRPSPPPISPPRVPPTVFPANNQTVNAPVQTTRNQTPINQSSINQTPINQTATNQMPVLRRGFGLFRGCLLIVFLLLVSSVALFFGVPYAIETMRETQRERNSEPPRFPVR